MEPIRVLIVDDLPHVRQGLVSLLQLAARSTIPPIELIGEAENGLEAVQQARALHPDVILMDLEMPVLDGYEATRQIKAEHPALRVIILSIHAGLEAEERARSAGADSFITKGASHQILVSAILACQKTKEPFDLDKGEIK